MENGHPDPVRNAHIGERRNEGGLDFRVVVTNCFPKIPNYLSEFRIASQTSCCLIELALITQGSFARQVLEDLFFGIFPLLSTDFAGEVETMPLLMLHILRAFSGGGAVGLVVWFL